MSAGTESPLSRAKAIKTLARCLEEYYRARDFLPETPPTGFSVEWEYEYQGNEFAPEITKQAKALWIEYRRCLISSLRAKVELAAREAGLDTQVASWIDEWKAEDENAKAKG